MSLQLDLARESLRTGNGAETLNRLTLLFRSLQQLSTLPPFPAGVKEADEMLEQLGRTILAASDPGRQDDRPLQGDCILATMVYPVGGHTALIKDLHNALPTPPRALWLTMANARADRGLKEGALERTGMADRVRLFDGRNLWACAQQMVRSLLELRPSRVLLLQHPDDCVAIAVAAAAAAMGSSVSLLHHADGVPSAGLYLSTARIVDFTPRACAFTRSMLGLQSSWLPLSCPDPGKPSPKFLTSGKLRTALSGSRDKIKGMTDPDYAELVSRVLETTGGTHLHIGPRDKHIQKALHAHMKKRGIPLHRLTWVEQVPALAPALEKFAVDLVLNTYPSGGARTAVEVMAAGRPMVWQSPNQDLDDVRTQMKYPEALLWRRPEDLLNVLKGIDPAWLRKQGQAARAYYERMHHPRLWQEFFASNELGESQKLPAGFDATQITRIILEHALIQNSVPQRSTFRQIWDAIRGKPSTRRSE